jgi:hypothetical protein
MSDQGEVASTGNEELDHVLHGGLPRNARSMKRMDAMIRALLDANRVRAGERLASISSPATASHS